MNQWPNPFIEQRADPFILRDGSHYYFIASVPEYDRRRYAGPTRWKGCAPPPRLSSGASQKAAP